MTHADLIAMLDAAPVGSVALGVGDRTVVGFVKDPNERWYRHDARHSSVDLLDDGITHIIPNHRLAEFALPATVEVQDD